MTNEELAIKRLEEIDRAVQILDSLAKTIGLELDSPLRQAWGEIIDIAIQATESALTGKEPPKDGWFSWFAYENEFGRAGLEAGCVERMRPITNAKEMIDMMMETE